MSNVPMKSIQLNGELAPGETAHYGKENCMLLKADGSVQVYTAGKLTLESSPAPERRVEQLARALFDTDEEVKAYVRTRCDSSAWTGPQALSVKFGAFDRAMDTCWRIDDRGFRTRCEARAKAMVERLAVR